MDLLCFTDIVSHDGRGCCIGGHYQPVSSTHRAGCAQERHIRNIWRPVGGCGRVNLAFRTALSDRPCSGSSMSTNAALEQTNIARFGERLVVRFCRSLFGATRENVS